MKWKVNRGIITYIEKISSLHDKVMTNNNLVIIYLIATYTTLLRGCTMLNMYGYT